MRPTVLIAIGGNSLIPAGEPPTVATQRRHVAETCRAIADVAARGWRVVLTHGNGPQVGAAVLRSERAVPEAYELPLDVCVASTQGEIGYLLQQALREALLHQRLRDPVATVLAQVVVAPDDAALAHPRKPIGPFYHHAQADRRRRAGWTIVEEPPHGYRRVVPSPEPLEIVEEGAIRTLVESGAIVITLGGGGIPVIRRGQTLEGVEAVIDKDLASALLATRLGVDVLLISTDVDAISLDFASPRARRLTEVTVDDLRGHAAAGQFPPGTMGPKVEAARRFVAAGGREAIVTSPNRLVAALEGHAGTHIFDCVPPGQRRPAFTSRGASRA
ncbi:MAG: carbamate kinase [Acidobacteria bacterium]|nr:carbamate kinase [Acidobacteriota bacterium]